MKKWKSFFEISYLRATYYNHCCKVCNGKKFNTFMKLFRIKCWKPSCWNTNHVFAEWLLFRIFLCTWKYMFDCRQQWSWLSFYAHLWRTSKAPTFLTAEQAFSLEMSWSAWGTKWHNQLYRKTLYSLQLIWWYLTFPWLVWCYHFLHFIIEYGISTSLLLLS